MTLAEQFAIPNHLSFKTGAGGLLFAGIANTHASATVALHGGQVITFQPHGHAPVLWASSRSSYQAGKAIRGGIPVCWPWFGPHPTDPDKPAHGFARTSLWTVLATGVAEDGATQIRLGLQDSDATRTLWPYAFDLQIVITVGPALQVELVIHNPGNEPFTCTGALHSYFSVSDVTAIAIHGLDGCTYIDQLDPTERKVQHGPITFAAETDRIYLDTTAACAIVDPGLRRRMVIGKAGSRSTVVWNPWIAKAQRMADFGEDEYLRMVCVETANAGTDVVTVPPSGEHRLRATLRVERP